MLDNNIPGLNSNSNADIRAAGSPAELDNIIRFTLKDSKEKISNLIESLPNNLALNRAFRCVQDAYQARTEYRLTPDSIRFRNHALAEALKALPTSGELTGTLRAKIHTLTKDIVFVLDGLRATEDLSPHAANIEIQVNEIISALPVDFPADVREKLTDLQTIAQQAQAESISGKDLDKEVYAALENFNTLVKNFQPPANQSAEYSKLLKDTTEKLKQEAAVYSAAAKFSLDACHMEHNSIINSMIGQNTDSIVDKTTGRLDPRATENLTEKLRSESYKQHVNSIVQKLQIHSKIKGDDVVYWISIGQEGIENSRALALQGVQDLKDNETAVFSRLPKHLMNVMAFTCLEAKTSSGKPVHAHFSGDNFYNESSFLDIRLNVADKKLNRLFDTWVTLPDADRDALKNYDSEYLQLFLQSNAGSRFRLSEILPQKKFDLLFQAIAKKPHSNPDPTPEAKKQFLAEKLNYLKECKSSRIERLDNGVLARNLYLLDDEIIKFILVKKGYGRASDSTATLIENFIAFLNEDERKELQLNDPQTGFGHSANLNINLKSDLSDTTDEAKKKLKAELKTLSLDIVHGILEKHQTDIGKTIQILENLSPQQKATVDLKYLSNALIDDNDFLKAFLTFRPIDEKFTRWFYSLNPPASRGKVFAALDANKRAVLFAKANPDPLGTHAPAESQAVLILQDIPPADFNDILQSLPNEALIKHLPELSDTTVGGTDTLMKTILDQKKFADIADLIEHTPEQDLKNLRLTAKQFATIDPLTGRKLVPIDPRFWGFAAKKSHLFSNELIVTLTKEGITHFGLEEFEEFLEHLNHDQKKAILSDTVYPRAVQKIREYVTNDKLSFKGLSHLFKDMDHEDFQRFYTVADFLANGTKTSALFAHAMTPEQLKFIFGKLNTHLSLNPTTRANDLGKFVSILNAYEDEAKKNDLIGALQQLPRSSLKDILFYEKLDGSTTPPKVLASLNSKIAINAIIQAFSESELRNFVSEPAKSNTPELLESKQKFMNKFVHDIALFSDDSIKKILRAMGNNVKSIKDIIGNIPADNERLAAFKILPDTVKKLLFVLLEPSHQRALLRADPDDLAVGKKLELIHCFSPENTPEMAEKDRAAALLELQNEVLALFTEAEISSEQKKTLFRILPLKLRNMILESDQITPNQKTILLQSISQEEQAILAPTAFEASDDAALKGKAFVKMTEPQRKNHLANEIRKLETSETELTNAITESHQILIVNSQNNDEPTRNTAKIKIKNKLKAVKQQLDVIEHLFDQHLQNGGNEKEIVGLFQLVTDNSTANASKSIYEKLVPHLDQGYSLEEQSKVFANHRHLIFQRLAPKLRAKILIASTAEKAKDLLDSFKNLDLTKSSNKKGLVDCFCSIPTPTCYEVYALLAADNDERYKIILQSNTTDPIKSGLLASLCPGGTAPISSENITLITECYSQSEAKTELLLNITDEAKRLKIFNIVLTDTQQRDLLNEALTNPNPLSAAAASKLFVANTKHYGSLSSDARSSLIRKLAEDKGHLAILKALYADSKTAKIDFFHALGTEGLNFFTHQLNLAEKKEIITLLLQSTTNTDKTLGANLYETITNPLDYENTFLALDSTSQKALVLELEQKGSHVSLLSTYKISPNKVDFFNSLNEKNTQPRFFDNSLDLAEKKDLLDLLLNSPNPKDVDLGLSLFLFLADSDLDSFTDTTKVTKDKKALYKSLDAKSKTVLLMNMLGMGDPISTNILVSHYFNLEENEKDKLTILENLPTDQRGLDFFNFVLSANERKIVFNHWLNDPKKIDAAMELFPKENYDFLCSLDSKSIAAVLNKENNVSTLVLNFSYIQADAANNQSVKDIEVFNQLDKGQKDTLFNRFIVCDKHSDAQKFLRKPQIYNELSAKQQVDVFNAYDPKQRVTLYIGRPADQKEDFLDRILSSNGKTTITDFFSSFAENVSNRPKWTVNNPLIAKMINESAKPLLDRLNFIDLIKRGAAQKFDQTTQYPESLNQLITARLEKTFDTFSETDYNKLSVKEKAYIWLRASDTMKEELLKYHDDDQKEKDVQDLLAKENVVVASTASVNNNAPT